MLEVPDVEKLGPWRDQVSKSSVVEGFFSCVKEAVLLGLVLNKNTNIKIILGFDRPPRKTESVDSVTLGLYREDHCLPLSVDIPEGLIKVTIQAFR